MDLRVSTPAEQDTDYYQREYKWQTKQVTELTDDLAAKFLASYEPGHERNAVAAYGHYFLGSIILSDKDGRKFIIDGQPRLTTLTLILIFLQHQLEDGDQKGQIAELILSQRLGRRSFNMDIEERAACMEALYMGALAQRLTRDTGILRRPAAPAGGVPAPRRWATK